MKNRFENRYQTGDLPWDIKRPDKNLVENIEKFNIKPGKALDVGCGTGDNALWLTKQGFETSGVDIAETAINLAREKAKKANLNTEFLELDFLNETIPGKTFDFIFDRGCFHSFDKKIERKKYAQQVFNHMAAEGLWLSLIGSYDDGRLDIGPPKRKAKDIVLAVEEYFEIIRLTKSRFDSNDEIPSVIWVCLLKKRNLMMNK